MIEFLKLISNPLIISNINYISQAIAFKKSEAAKSFFLKFNATALTFEGRINDFISFILIHLIVKFN